VSSFSIAPRLLRWSVPRTTGTLNTGRMSHSVRVGINRATVRVSCACCDSATDIFTEDLTQVSSRISITVGELRTEAPLFDDEAPIAVSAFLKALPITDKTVQVRWSGSAWRTEQDYPLVARGSTVENKVERLAAGDIIYFPPVKIGVAYGPAQWLNPFMSPIDVTHLGKIDRKLEEFIAQCGLIIYRGPLPVRIERIS
jgi:hypothetical protein